MATVPITSVNPVLGQGALIVAPTYDERSNIDTFVESARGVAPSAHILIVDDNSPDGTGASADGLAARDERVRALRRPSKLGLGTADSEAFQLGLHEDCRRFVEMDADLSHDPRHLPEFFRELEAGADVMVGSRNIPGGNVPGWGAGRHALSKGCSRHLRLMRGVGVADLTSGYNGFQRDALSAVLAGNVVSKGYSFQVEMTYRALRLGLSLKEVPTLFVNRQGGASKMDRKVALEAVDTVWKLQLRAVRHA